MTFADWISHRGLTDEAVANLIGLDRSSVSRLRRGENLPSWETAARIKRVTKGAVTADDFLPVLTA